MTTTARTTRTNLANVATVTHEWGAVDAKGRVVGLFIRTEEVDLVPMTDETGASFKLQAGHYFIAQMQMTKDGNAWGATQAKQYFTTLEERTAAITKRLADLMKKTGTI